jgi:GDPmannose 4,6-dehydratase
MLQQNIPSDYVIATGEINPLESFVAEVFAQLGLNWHDYVSTDPSLLRPSEIMVSRGNPDKAARDLGWQAKHHMKDVIRIMIAAEQEKC